MRFLATFYTQAAALLTNRRLKQSGVKSAPGPVPRALSSSCGTCVRYEADDAMLGKLDADVESVYTETDAGYNRIYHHE